MTRTRLLPRLIATLAVAAPLWAAAQDAPGGPPLPPPGGTQQDNPLPEPGTLALVGLAVAGAVALRRRK